MWMRSVVVYDKIRTGLRVTANHFHLPPKLLISIERGLKKRKTRSSCSGIELISAFHVLQNFRDKITTEDVVELDDSNLELEIEV